MKTYHLILIVIFSFCCNGCRQQKTNQEELIHIDFKSITKRNIILEHVDQCKFVKLETTDDCLIREIVKIDFDDDKIFIKDKNKKVFVFNEAGTFLNQIGHIGSGPNEQLGIHDFFLDKSNRRIELFDMLQSTIFSYTYSGDLIESKKVKRDVFEDFAKMTLTSDNQLILSMDNSKETPFNYRLVDQIKYVQYSDYVPYLLLGETPLSFSGTSKMTQSKNTLYLSAFLSDTIYKYDDVEKKILPVYVFKGKHKPLVPADFTNRNFEVALDALTVAKAKKRSTGIKQLYATDYYMHFLFDMDRVVYRLFWDIEKHTGSYYPLVGASTLTNFFTYVIGSTDKAFVCAIPAEEAIRHYWEESEMAQIVVKDTYEDDNPILIYYYFNF